MAILLSVQPFISCYSKCENMPTISVAQRRRILTAIQWIKTCKKRVTEKSRECDNHKRDNRNTKRTEKHKNKMTHGKTRNKSPRRINHKATKSKTNTGTTARCKFYTFSNTNFCCVILSAALSNTVFTENILNYLYLITSITIFGQTHKFRLVTIWCARNY